VFLIENYLLHYFLSISKYIRYWRSLYEYQKQEKNYENLFIPVIFWVKFVIYCPTLASDIKKVFPPSQGD
jgi:hypothetical protein